MDHDRHEDAQRGAGNADRPTHRTATSIIALDVNDLIWPQGLEGVLESSTPARVIARYEARRPELVQSKASLEGLSFTVPEVVTLLDGVTTDGARIEDVEVLRSLATASDLARDRARAGRTHLPDLELANAVNRVLTERTLLAPGVPRSRDGLAREGSDGRIAVTLADGRVFYTARGTDLDTQLAKAATRLDRIEDPSAKALAYIAVATYLQPYADGNKRTARLVADAWLLSLGIEPPEVPARARAAYHRALTRMFASGDLGVYAGFLANAGRE